MTSVDSNFNFLCGRPHGAGPPSPVHMRPPDPDPLPPPCGRHKWMAPRGKRSAFLNSSIHCSMDSAPVGAQCPLTSSLGELLGYWDWSWYPGLSPVLVSIALLSVFHISVFSIHSSSPAIGFHSSIFHGGGICNPPPTILLISDLGLALCNWISEKVEIPWWWNYNH